jgi:hypothetical protein
MPTSPKPLSEDDIKSICGREIAAAESHAGTLSSNRQDALDYYMGRNRWASKPGQSSVVTRETCETIEWLLPQLIKVFASTDEVVRFEPQGPEDEQASEQATDLVNFIWARDNPGFLTLHTWTKDALIGGLGIIKIWWMDEPKVRHEDLGGLSEMQLTMLMQDGAITISAAEQSDIPGPPGPDGQPTPLYDVRLTYEEPDGRVCVEPVPPEEYLFLPSVKCDTDPGQGHRRRVTQSDLIEQGYDPGLVDDLPTADEDDEWGERSHRQYPSSLEDVNRDSRDRASRLVEITEWYTKLDLNGDGRTEWVKVTLGGTNDSKVLDTEEIDGPPFAVLTPLLMPHRLDGLSICDLVKDLQEIKTSITRQMLNSLYLANKPRTWAVDGQVNLQELLNSEAGGVVRVKAPGMVGELNSQFVGAAAFPMLEYIDRTLEGRSGVSKLSQGIDADVLKGGAAAAQTATGVAALQSAAQQRVELICRVMAETGIKRAFKLILSLVTKYQQSERVIRLRNQWVPMDPRSWNSEMDLVTEVGLGTGNKQEQLGYLTQVLTGQKELLQMGGLGLVSPKELYNTYAKLVQLSGLKSVDNYFLDPAKQPPTPPQPPQPDPNMAMVQVQMQVEQGKLALAREKMMREDDRERDRLDADISLKAAELQAKYGAQVNMAQIRAAVDRDREAMKQQAALTKHVTPPAPQLSDQARGLADGPPQGNGMMPPGMQ